MSVTTHRKDIEQRMVTLALEANVGKVLYGRHPAREPEEFLSQFTELQEDNTRLIRGWEFYVDSMQDLRTGTEGVPTNQVRRVFNFRLDGFLAFDEGSRSEETFGDMVETMMSTISAQIRLGTNMLRIKAPSVNLGIDTMGNYTVHTAEISVTVEEQVPIT